METQQKTKDLTSRQAVMIYKTEHQQTRDDIIAELTKSGFEVSKERIFKAIETDSHEPVFGLSWFTDTRHAYSSSATLNRYHKLLSDQSMKLWGANQWSAGLRKDVEIASYYLNLRWLGRWSLQAARVAEETSLRKEVQGQLARRNTDMVSLQEKCRKLRELQASPVRTELQNLETENKKLREAAASYKRLNLESRLAAAVAHKASLSETNVRLQGHLGVVARQRTQLKNEWADKVAVLNTEVATLKEKNIKDREKAKRNIAAMESLAQTECVANRKLLTRDEALEQEVTALKAKNQKLEEQVKGHEVMKKENLGLTNEIKALKEQTKKLRVENKVAVRKAKAEMKVEWEKKVLPLEAQTRTLQGQKRKLETDLEVAGLDAGISKAEHDVLELKLKKAGWAAGAEDMEIVRAEMKVLQLKLERSEKVSKRKEEAHEDERARKRIKTE